MTQQSVADTPAALEWPDYLLKVLGHRGSVWPRPGLFLLGLCLPLVVSPTGPKTP